MGKLSSPATLPVIPHTRGSVLLPGIIQRLPVSSAGSRTDVAAILTNIYTRAASPGPNETVDNVPVACVPIKAPFLSNGQLLIENAADRTEGHRGHGESHNVTKNNLYNYGVAAKILGIEGSGSGEFYLRIEGTCRIGIEKIVQERPFFEAKVRYFKDEIPTGDAEFQAVFSNLKQKSRELVTALRITSLLPRQGNGTGLSPMLLRRLDLFIAQKETKDAGVLSDFMANIVESTYEEKLDILSSVNVKERMARVVEMLDRQIGGLKGHFKVITWTGPSPSEIVDRLSKRQNNSSSLSLPFGLTPPPNGQAPFMPGFGQGDNSQEPDELDELKKKLEAALLPPDAQKAAERELKRLRKMSPANQEYQVTRNWLEVLAEIPWSAVTDDRLGKDALARARKQLDEDHYGLDRVKKRLLEYLAVLRLKQQQNEELDAQIKRVTEEIASVDDKNKEDPSGEATTTANISNNQARLRDTKLEILKAKRMIDKSPILLLVGPPGVGKTSLAKSVATALNRKFHRISLGGVRDEAEIRGHRRTYVAAMPGLVVQGLRKVGVANPVFLLDEIDKLVGANVQGDPGAAMLEVLDPEQNHTFTDHYVGLPLDLSRVLFIATANSLDTIPPPLLDRMEMIYLPGYTTLEKQHIAMQHLVPKQLRANGLAEGQVAFTLEVVGRIIEAYTREAGVRNLEREIGSVCRAKAVEYAESRDAGLGTTATASQGSEGGYRAAVSVEDLEEILGIEKFEAEIAEKTSRPGIVTGLVAYSSGGSGSILFIEVADMPGKGGVQLTGRLGAVLKESVEVALSWVKAHAYELGLTGDPATDIMQRRAIHVHCPSGAIPKDGPSSGIAQAIALISLFSGRAVPPTMAMTGEISLRGRVTAVGGIKEKLIGALRAGVKTVLLPAQNRKDVKDLPQEVKDGLEILHVGHIWEAIRLVWPDSQWPGEQQAVAVESRL